MTQINSEGLLAARRALSTRFKEPDSYLDDVAEKIITAYLSTLPQPTGDVGALIAKARKPPWEPLIDRQYKERELALDLADALAAQAAKLAECEREVLVQMEHRNAQRRRAEAAEARLAGVTRERDEAFARLVRQSRSFSEGVLDQIRIAEIATTERKAATARAERLEAEMERIADLTERWKDSLVSQVNEIARAALSGDAKPASEAGMVLVPREPTRAMADAAQAVPSWFQGMPAHWQNIWDAMIAASQQEGT